MRLPPRIRGALLACLRGASPLALYQLGSCIHAAAAPVAPAPAPDASGVSHALPASAAAVAAPPAPGFRPGLPIYTAAEVAAHSTPATRIWVTHSDGVYDVTDFLARHPGGAARLLLAAGGSVDAFWAVYAQHRLPHVAEELAKLRVGTLAAADAARQRAAVAEAGDPYSRDPARSPLLRPHTLRPYNGEPLSSALLVDSYITPVELAFVRHHMPVPLRDAGEGHELRVALARPAAAGGGAAAAERVYTLGELRARFAPHTVVAALTCSGNRRGDMSAAKASRGLSWGVGAMANLEWTGVWLHEVLADAGVTAADWEEGEEEEGAGKGGDSSAAGGSGSAGDARRGWLRHVHFSGLDADPSSGTRYAASIPADIALSPRRDVLLAWALNGAPIPADHGGPLRAVVPGVTGARQVKWLARIDAASDESPSMWQQLDYRIVGPNATAETVDFSAVPSMQDMAVNSAICDPPLVVPPPVLKGSPPAAATAAPRAHLVREADGTARVRGWAWSGGGRAISRVDVSADGGASWMTADIDAQPADASPSRTRSWGWTLWSAYVPLPPRQADVTLVAKATDVAGNSQPESALAIYNFRGLGNNSWHRVRATVESK